MSKLALFGGEPTVTYVGTNQIEKNPLVVLDENPVDGAYMIEYDKGNADKIVEAGILFGSSSMINLSSTDGSKAASQRNGADNSGHGQFSASHNGEESYVRGYLVYEKNKKNFVIYTAAMHIGE